MASLIIYQWKSLEEGPRGSEPVINVATDIVTDHTAPGYDERKFLRLVEETKFLLIDGKYARVVVYSRAAMPDAHRAC